MERPNTILVYSDYKSPYAFLAKDLIYELEGDLSTPAPRRFRLRPPSNWMPAAIVIQVGSDRACEARPGRRKGGQKNKG
jgi:hypothetical protein